MNFFRRFFQRLFRGNDVAPVAEEPIYVARENQNPLSENYQKLYDPLPQNGERPYGAIFKKANFNTAITFTEAEEEYQDVGGVKEDLTHGYLPEDLLEKPSADINTAGAKHSPLEKSGLGKTGSI